MRTKTFPVILLTLGYAVCFSQTADSSRQVMIGYGSQGFRFTTGAVSHLDAGTFNRGQIYDWNQLWQGLVPGLMVARAGSNPNEPYDVRMRGLHTINGRTQPLYVVDGVPGVDALAIDPNEIVSVDILRDAASTAIYGGRGAAGVVLISTRRAQAGEMRAYYSNQISFESAAKRYKVLGEQAFLDLGGIDLSPSETVNTNWQDEVLRQGIGQAHHLGLSGGIGAGTDFSVSFHYRNQEGILRNTGFRQYNGNMTVSQKLPGDRVTLSGGLTLASREKKIGYPEAYRYAVTANPSSPVRSGDPQFEPYGGYVSEIFFDYFNPVSIIEQNRHDGTEVYGLGYLRAEAQLLPGLHAMLLLAKEQNRENTSEYNGKQSQFRGIGSNGRGRKTEDVSQQDILESTLRYHFRFSQLGVQLLGGYSWQQADNDGRAIDAGNLISDVLEDNNFGSFTNVQSGDFSVSGYRARARLAAFFGRAQLQWDSTFFLNAGARREGSSMLGKNARWGTFPFFSGGADLARLFGWRHIGQMKIRLGKGVSGGLPAEGLLSQVLFLPTADFYYNGGYVPGYYWAQAANPELGWERHSEWSYGLDFSLLRGRLQGSLDLYRYTSSDLIVRQIVKSPPSLNEIQYQNAAELSGKGVELSLNYTGVQNQNVTWEFGLTASRFSTVIETYGRPDTFDLGIAGSPGLCCPRYQLIYPGAGLGTFWGPVTDGELDGNGELIFKNIDKNPDIDINSFQRDQAKIGTGVPKWEFGFRQRFAWKRFDLNLMLRAVTGHTLANEMRLFYENINSGNSHWNKVVTEYYDERNKSQNRISSWIMEDASFLRLQNLSLGYRFKLPEKSGIRSLYLQAGAQNLLTITGYTGIEPEARLADTGTSDNGSRSIPVRVPLTPGVDRRNTYPMARVLWFGVRAGL
ncbi:MAG: SusC/RagA family TonB-linked outer membrane protein [Saprospiraceae bacterium]